MRLRSALPSPEIHMVPDKPLTGACAKAFLGQAARQERLELFRGDEGVFAPIVGQEADLTQVSKIKAAHARKSADALIITFPKSGFFKSGDSRRRRV